MSQLDPYLFFDGTCAEAMRFYEKALGGKLEIRPARLSKPAPAARRGDEAMRSYHCHQERRRCDS